MTQKKPSQDRPPEFEELEPIFDEPAAETDSGLDELEAAAASSLESLEPLEPLEPPAPLLLDPEPAPAEPEPAAPEPAIEELEPVAEELAPAIDELGVDELAPVEDALEVAGDELETDELETDELEAIGDEAIGDEAIGDEIGALADELAPAEPDLAPLVEDVALGEPEPEPLAAELEPVAELAPEPDPAAIVADVAPTDTEPEPASADLEPIAEPEPAVPSVVAAAAPVAAAAAAAPRRSSTRDRAASDDKKKKKDAGPPPAKPGTASRELEQAPKLLGKAAWILVFGCVFPWMWAVQTNAAGEEVTQPGLPQSMMAKVLIVLGAFVFHQGLKRAFGDSAQGFAKKLDIPIKKASRKSHGWNLGEIVGLLIMLAGLLPLVDSQAFLTTRMFLKVGMSLYGDKGMLVLGCLTVSHIYAYSKGSHFNPIFAIIFLGPAVAGVSSILKNGVGWWTPGALAASAAGILAVYTIGVALKQAKAEGDAKRAAQAEARRTSRQRRTPK